MNDANQGGSTKRTKSALLRLAILANCLVAGMILIGAVILFYPPRDPEYQGKRLSTWIKNFNSWDWPKRPDAEILQHYGSSAEPLLKHMLRARDSSLETKFWKLLSRQHFIKIHIEPAGPSQLRALDICNLLNTKVKGTLPEIEALVSDFANRPRSPSELSDYWLTATYALNTLAAMGPDGVRGLRRLLSNQNAEIRCRTAELLGTMPDSAIDEVVASLTRAATDTNDPQLLQKASQALQLIRERQNKDIHAQATNFVQTADPISPVNVWDAYNIRILSNSGLEQGQGVWQATDLFGTRSSRTLTGETGSIVFDDNQPDGFTHFIEWATPLPVTIRSFGLIASHDGASSAFQRAFRSFKLYARATEADPFDLIYSENVTVPYGEGPFACMLYLYRNLEGPVTVTAKQFRAEFVQNGVGSWHGPRAIELYGFTAPLNRPMVLEALKNQDMAVRKLGEAHFQNQK